MGPPRMAIPMAYSSGGDHLAGIEKLSNGFIVRFQKAQKVAAKKKTIDTLGFDAETKDIRLGLSKMKEGESWKGAPDDMKALDNDAPMDKWITTSMAIACKDEKELLEAIRAAVTAHAEIEKLGQSGEFDTIC